MPARVSRRTVRRYRRADEAAHDLILQELHRIAPGVAVISEEAVAEWRGKSVPEEFLLVDPLDGTLEFLAGRPEYTVNIALVRHGTPVVGMVAAPALGLIWTGRTGCRASAALPP